MYFLYFFFWLGFSPFSRNNMCQKTLEKQKGSFISLSAKEQLYTSKWTTAGERIKTSIYSVFFVFWWKWAFSRR